MKSYLSAFGKALIVTSLPRYFNHRSMDRKFFSQKARYRKKYGLTRENQGSFFEFVNFFAPPA
jgi:hypothetical protein